MVPPRTRRTVITSAGLIAAGFAGAVGSSGATSNKDEDKKAPRVRTQMATNVENKPRLNGMLIHRGDYEKVEVFFIWKGPDTDGWRETSKLRIADSGGFFTKIDAGKKYGTYKFMAVAKVNGKRYSGKTRSFIKKKRDKKDDKKHDKKDDKKHDKKHDKKDDEKDDKKDDEKDDKKDDEKDDKKDDKKPPRVRTQMATNVEKRPRLNGMLVDKGDYKHVDVFFKWKGPRTDGWRESSYRDISSSGGFFKKLDPIKKGETYKFMAVAKVNGKRYSGKTRTFSRKKDGKKEKKKDKKDEKNRNYDNNNND